MKELIHCTAFALFPVFVSTPKCKLPTPEQEIQLRLTEVKKEMHKLKLKRCELRAEERKLEILINELELLLVKEI